MNSSSRIVIVGASLAGLRAAESLRRAKYDGKIVLIGDEQHTPYDRPPLSKQFLASKLSSSELALRNTEKLDELKMDIKLGVAAARLDISNKEVTLHNGEVVEFDGLIIATGARARNLPDCNNLGGVHTLRTRDDAEALREGLAKGARLTVVGAGFIGAEVAATAREAGNEVAMIERLKVPLAHALGEDIGNRIAELHREKGVDLRLGVSVEKFEGNKDVEGILLSDGSRVETDLVLIGIGVQPNTEWLEGSGLTIDDGIVCDETLQAAEGIYAAGDVARVPHPMYPKPTRIEHWTNAGEQAHTAALNLLASVSEKRTFSAVPYFWSDQYEASIQLVGRAAGSDEMLVAHGSLDAMKFVTLYRRGDALAGACTISLAGRFIPYREMLRQGVSWDEAIGSLKS